MELSAQLPVPTLLRQERVLKKGQALLFLLVLSSLVAGLPGFAAGTPPPCPLPSWPVEGVMTVLSLLKRSLTLDLTL